MRRCTRHYEIRRAERRAAHALGRRARQTLFVAILGSDWLAVAPRALPEKIHVLTRTCRPDLNLGCFGGLE